MDDINAIYRQIDDLKKAGLATTDPNEASRIDSEIRRLFCVVFEKEKLLIGARTQ